MSNSAVYRRFAIILGILGALLLSPLSWARADDGQFFPVTGHTVKGAFLTFYQAHGGLDVFGQPRTEQLVENGRTVQYFQRARMEWWPENPPEFQVQLGLVGDLLRPGDLPLSAGPAGARFFPETGHSIGGAFLAFWEGRGGLAIFGYPTTEPFVENGRTVQYFQRARLEAWPENPPPYQVQLGLLGDEYIFGRGLVPLSATSGRDGPPARLSASDQPAANQAGSGRTGGRIVFQVASGGEIYTVRPDGSDLRLVGHGLDPSWSPDGTSILYANWNDSPGIYRMQADGSAPERLVAGDQIQSPIFSPQGTQIAYHQKYAGSIYRLNFRTRRIEALPDDQWRIAAFDLASGKSTELPRELHAFSPTWAPDGTRVAYKGDKGLYVTALGGKSTLIPNTDSRFASPTWSPAGDQLAFMYLRHDHWEIGVVNVDGSGFRLLTSPANPLFAKASDAVAPAWSPDGTKIAFASNQDGQWKLYWLPAAGGEVQKILDLPIAYDWASERVLSWTGTG